MQDLPERNLRHLRSVPSGHDLPSDSIAGVPAESAVEQSRNGPTRGLQNVQLGGLTLATAFQREQRLFTAVRAPATFASTRWQSYPSRAFALPVEQDAAAPSPHGVRLGEAPQLNSSDVEPQDLKLPVSISDVGSRFEALASLGATTDRAEERERIDQALSRLRGRSELESLLLPSAALRDLSAANPEAVARWLVALLGSLHRTRSVKRLDLDLRVAVKSATALTESTVIDSPSKVRARRERDAIVRGRPDLLAAAVFGRRSWRVRGRVGLAVLAELAGQPHSLQSLLEDGVDPGPLAIWSLVAASIPAADVSKPFTLVHRTSGNASRTVTVQASPGRPLRVVAGETASAQLIVETHRSKGLAWAGGQSPAVSLEGSALLEADALRLFEQSFSTVRTPS